jgi:hypothetical protein
MKRFLALALVASIALVFCAGSAFAAAPSNAKLSGRPLPSEMAFVQGQTKALNARYPTPADAEKAGYFRYNNEDETGAISYANLHWNSNADPSSPQPAQLWYDVHGHLLGADYSVPLSPKPPHLWGLNPQRWFRFGRPHIHYILKGTSNAAYGHAIGGAAWTKAGGSFKNPSAATLVKMHKVKSASDVAKVFVYPAMWDTEIWVTPNPLGAFAEKNPLVHPTKDAQQSM